MVGKTNKSVSKRFRVTKNGKVLHRKGPKNHFRAKQSSKTIRGTRSMKELSKPDAKKIKLMI